VLYALLCLAFFVFSVYLIIEGFFLYPQRYPEVAASNSPWIIGWGVFILGITLYESWKLITRWNESAVVYQDGFAHYRGKDLPSFKWVDIAAITMRAIKMTYYGIIPTGTMHKYTLYNRDGEKYKLDGIMSKIEELILQIRQGIFPHLMNEYKTLFNAGKPLEFGHMIISRSGGVRKGNKTYPWQDIAQIAMDKGTVHIVPKKRGLFRGFTQPVESIPNVDVFLTISKEMIQ